MKHPVGKQRRSSDRSHPWSFPPCLPGFLIGFVFGFRPDQPGVDTPGSPFTSLSISSSVLNSPHFCYLPCSCLPGFLIEILPPLLLSDLRVSVVKNLNMRRKNKGSAPLRKPSPATRNVMEVIHRYETVVAALSTARRLPSGYSTSLATTGTFHKTTSFQLRHPASIGSPNPTPWRALVRRAASARPDRCSFDDLVRGDKCNFRPGGRFSAGSAAVRKAFARLSG